MNGSVVPVFKPGLFSLVFDGGLVVGDSNRLYVLNAAAGAIWTLLESKLSIGEAVSVLKQSFGLSEDGARSDLHAMLEQWTRLGLLESTSPHKPDDHYFEIASPKRLSRSVEAAFSIGGITFSIQTNSEDVAAHVFAALRIFKVNKRPDHVITAEMKAVSPLSLLLIVDDDERFEVANAAEMVGAIFQTMIELVRGESNWLAIIHGAAISHNGMGILLSGAGGSGKSTLAAYLSARGFGYLSDDLIALSPRGAKIVPWPVAHSLKRGSWKVLEKFYPAIPQIDIEVIGGREIKFIPSPEDAWNNVGVSADIIVFPRYDGSNTTKLVKVRAFQALQMLVDDRIWLGHPITKKHVEAFLRELAKMRAYVLEYSDLQEAEVNLRQLIQG